MNKICVSVMFLFAMCFAVQEVEARRGTFWQRQRKAALSVCTGVVSLPVIFGLSWASLKAGGMVAEDVVGIDDVHENPEILSAVYAASTVGAAIIINSSCKLVEHITKKRFPLLSYKLKRSRWPFTAQVVAASTVLAGFDIHKSWSRRTSPGKRRRVEVL